MKRRVTVEISLPALVRNYKRIASHVEPLSVLCVLKANAYGLGVASYAKALYDAGCRMFGVAEPFEARELRGVLPKDADIQILSSILPDEIDEMIDLDIILPIIDFETAKLISASAAKAGKCAKVHFKIDSGMGRLGILLSNARNTIKDVLSLPNLKFDGIFSHCPMAYDPKDSYTLRQIDRFVALVEDLKTQGIEFNKVHLAASDAVNNFPATCKEPFTVVRTGINLHGSFDPNGQRALNLEPVLTLRTRVAQVRNLPAGTTLGYGRTWCLNEPSRVATISAGYADGLPLALTNRGSVFIGGKRCPIIGRISMDYTTVDVSHVEDVKPGDEVICLGASGDDSITPDDWANLKGTHPYDILCSIGSRVERTVRVSENDLI